MATDDDVGAVTEAVARALRTFDWRLLELELRLGAAGADGRFVPDVGEARFEAIRARLEAGGHASRRSTTIDRRYAGDDGEVRETTAADATHAVRVRKKRLADVPVPGLGRASVSLEGEDVADGRPTGNGGPTTCVRRKSRVSYAMGAWRVDLTRVVASDDPDCDVATYEVEVELADVYEVFRAPLRNVVARGVDIAVALEPFTTVARRRGA